MKRLFGLSIALLVCSVEAAVPFWYAEFPDAKVRVNYDEARVAPYRLEDPLVFADGRKVESEADWRARRAEILGIFEREMYGKRPPLPETVVADLVDERVTCGGTVVQRQYEMTFRADRSGPKIRWIAFLPKAAKGKVPVILLLNYHGNQSLVDDPSIPMMTAWHRNGTWATNNLAIAATRGLLQRSESATVFPVEEFVARGYAVMSACYCEVSPDPNRIGTEDPKPMQDKLAYTGVFDLWPKRDPNGKSETTSLGAWSWALSRGLDLAERIPEIDAKRSVVTGYSRLGKAALLAAAYDERFAVCVPVQTGNGGVPLAKRDFGENPGTETRQFTHWFCRAYDKYRDEPWKTLTFDQHLLLASVAPRSLLVLGFNNPWFDARGEFLSCRAASSVWERFAGGGLPRTDFPMTGETTAVGDRLGYARRDGPHAIDAWDWRNILDFADTSFGRRPAFPRTELKSGSFQAAIDAAAAQGGGRVNVPAGHHVTPSLTLRSNVELHLEKGAVLEGSPRIEDYPVVELPCSEGAWMAVVMAVGATNVAITGEGEIYGNGSVFPRYKVRNQEGRRPRGLFFGNCRNVRLEGFSLRDSGCWGCVVQCCEDVTIRGLRIDNHANDNNDGIDLEARNVLIADCDIDAGDDGVCLKSNNPDFIVENVIVSNVFVRSHCVPLKIGTASHGIVRNILFTDCRTAAPRRDWSRVSGECGYEPACWREWGEAEFPGWTVNDPAALSAIALECVDGGAVENVTCRNITIDGGCIVPIFVRAGTRTGRSTGVPPGRHNRMKGILFENITGHSDSAVPSSVTGVPAFRVKDVTFRNVRLVGRGGGENAAERTRPVPEYEGRTPGAGMFQQALPAYGLWARHVDGLVLEDTTFDLLPGTFDRREKIVLDDVVGAP